MSTPTVEAVVAGSKGFAVALLAPLTERVGVRPRIAADATQALGLVVGPNGLAVLEVQGDGTVAAIEALLPDRNGLRVVAAVPEALAGLEARLRAAGVELARWDGKALGVLEAVTRATAGGMPAPASPSGAPLQSPPAQAPARQPNLTPPPAGQAGTVPFSTQAVAPALTPSRPLQPVAPALTPSRPLQPVAPALTPSRPMQPVAPALTPSRTMQPVAPALAPSRPAQAVSPALTPSRPMQPVAPGPASPVEASFAAAPPRPSASSSAVDALFDSLETDVDVGGPPAASVPVASPARAPLRPGAALEPPAAAAAWPAGGPSPEEAEGALASALAGFGEPDSPLGAVAALVSATLSDLERAAVEGAPIPLDAATFRRSAGMRVRVAAALASLPPSGSAVDAAALSSMLGEIDALLSSVAALAKDASQDLMPSLEAVRNGLVKEAIDFSEAAQRVAPAGAAPIAEKAVRSARAAQARVLSVSAADVEAPTDRRRIALFVVLGLALAGAAGFHGYRYVRTQQAIAARPTMPGQPEGLLLLQAAPGGVRKLVPLPGAQVDRAQMERFKAHQQTMGFEVSELAGGAVEIRPPREGAGGSSP